MTNDFFEKIDKANTANTHDCLYYTLWGQHVGTDQYGYPTIDSKDKNCFAYHDLTTDKRYIKYYRGDEFNPMDDMSALNKRDTPGLPSFKYMEVNKEKFDYYIEFLKTKTQRFYTLARRVFNAR